MQILGNIFNAIIFVSAIGGIFCVLSLFINHILRCTLPLWFPLCGMILFCVPFLSPDVFLISPETQEWLNGFYIACWVWVCGCGILFVYDTIRSIMAKRALKGYQIYHCCKVITNKPKKIAPGCPAKSVRRKSQESDMRVRFYQRPCLSGSGSPGLTPLRGLL